ncbi:MAG: pseudouridine synthase [Candidatus Omnitrophota bacterium]
MKQRLQTVIACAGIASRRASAKLVEEGKVKVDGKVVFEKGFRVDLDKNKIYVNGKLLPQKEKKYYFLFHKPKNVISTARDTHNRKIITDFFKDIQARLYPVGRLDRDTTGAIIVTNDGPLAHKLMHPSFEVEKEYMVLVKEALSSKALKELRMGVKLDEKLTSPCRIKEYKTEKDKVFLSKGTIYCINLHEGRNRQIRRMFETCGTRVLELKRVRYAGLSLKGVKQGEYRELTEAEVEKLKTKLNS